MTWTSRYPTLNRLVTSLEATGVLSKDYTRDIIGDAIMACSEAYAAGVEAERERHRKVLEDIADGALDPRAALEGR